MQIVSFRSLAICAIVALLSACTGSQMQTTPLANAPQIARPAALTHANVACPVVGKTYTIPESGGTISAKVASVYTKNNTTKEYNTTLVFNSWPENHSTLQQLVVSTCGPMGNAPPPFGSQDWGGGSMQSQCQNQICKITINTRVRVTENVPSFKGKAYKFVVILAEFGRNKLVPLFRETIKR